MTIKSKITDKLKEEILLNLKKEKNTVVKERLTFILMYINGINKTAIAKILNRNAHTIGKWINAYLNNGINAIKENRGGDNKSFLNKRNKKELKHIITNTYPITFKGWDGKLIVDLIKSHYNVEYTRSGVYALMKNMNITHKVAKKIDPKKSELKINTWKKDIKKTS